MRRWTALDDLGRQQLFKHAENELATGGRVLPGVGKEHLQHLWPMWRKHKRRERRECFIRHPQRDLVSGLEKEFSGTPHRPQEHVHVLREEARTMRL